MTFPHYLFGASLVVSAIVAYPTTILALETTQIKEIADNVTVLINSKFEDPNTAETRDSHGSGAIVARQGSTYYVLTSMHVVQNPQDDYQYTITTVDGETHDPDNSTIQHINGVDLAVIAFQSDRNYKTAQIESSVDRITPGISVYINGFPLAGEEIKEGNSQFTQGILTGMNSNHADGYNLVYDNFTRRGMSGGPVLNAQGKLIGIHGRAESEIIESKNSENCQQSEPSEDDERPPGINLSSNKSQSPNCEATTLSREKIDLNLGISIATFVELASSMGITEVLDTPATNKPTRPPVLQTRPDTDSGCSGVHC